MATFINGALPASNRLDLSGDTPLLTLKELSALQRAPKRRSGTDVTVYAYDIRNAKGGLGSLTPERLRWRSPDHMYVQYDDGREQLLARGGPAREGADLVAAALANDLAVTGGVTRAHSNRDYGKGERVMFRGFAPGMTAREAAMPAQRLAEELSRDPRSYTARSNSHSFAADAVEPLFGVRPGDAETWGYDRSLRTANRPHPIDLTPAITAPFYD
jgi:hypothetical protein